MLTDLPKRLIDDAGTAIQKLKSNGPDRTNSVFGKLEQTVNGDVMYIDE